MIDKYLHADTFYLCVKTLILSTLNIKCTINWFSKRTNTKWNPQLPEMVSICLLNRISNHLFTWLLQSARSKSRRVDQSNEFQPNMQLLWQWKMCNQEPTSGSWQLPEAALPPPVFLLLAWAAFSEVLPSPGCQIPSPVHLFSKGLGMFPDATYTVVRWGREQLVTFADF